MTQQTRGYLELQADRVEGLLAAHRAPGRVTGGTVGPRVIQFHLSLAPQVKFSTLRNLADDLALALRVPALRVDRSPHGIVLEFPNPNPRPVQLQALLKELQTLPELTLCCGLTSEGVPLLARLTSPDVAHILIAGTTGSGKSTLLRTLAASLVLSNPPDMLAVLAIDPKARTFPQNFSPPQLLRPVVTDDKTAAELLRSLVRLMENRDRYGESRPATVLFIDELADLLMKCTAADELLARLLQRGREAGIHVIAATQRPSAALLSGLMRANFPLRLVGRVVSPEDSRIASGRGGVQAERLEGRGDFVAVTGGEVLRFQAAVIEKNELQRAVAHLPGAPPLRLPVAPEPTLAEPAPDDLDLLTERLRPWWKQHGGEWGSKTAALRFLFGENVPTGGSYWRLTEATIANLEAEQTARNSTTTAILPAPTVFEARETG